MTEISNEKYEELRLIVEEQNGRAYTFDGAKEIGDGLIDFFALLMRIENEGHDLDSDEEVQYTELK